MLVAFVFTFVFVRIFRCFSQTSEMAPYSHQNRHEWFREHAAFFSEVDPSIFYGTYFQACNPGDGFLSDDELASDCYFFSLRSL